MQIQRLTLDQVIELVQTRPEQIVFDTKRDFVPPRDDEARAEFVKDAVAIANGTAFTHGPGFVVYGVDPNVPGTVTGVTSSYDDASLQQLVAAYVDPMIDFVFYDDIDAGDGKRLAVLHVPMSKKPLHVVKKDVGKLREGQSVIRQGSATRGVTRADQMKLYLTVGGGYVEQVLQRYGAAAQVMNAENARLQIIRNEINELDRLMHRMAGLGC